jgi:hypothetical protein
MNRIEHFLCSNGWHKWVNGDRFSPRYGRMFPARRCKRCKRIERRMEVFGLHHMPWPVAGLPPETPMWKGRFIEE